MRRAGGGAIINIGSVSWHLALPDLVLYETAKAGDRRPHARVSRAISVKPTFASQA